MDVLELKQVSKRFGELEVIKDLSFTVPEHSVFGFIGKNGAGKTTTMNMILGFLQVDHGEIRVCGEKVTYGNSRTNKKIGYLPDVPEFYGYMSPIEYLNFCGEISGLNKSYRDDKIKDLLTLVGLDGNRRKIRGFSRGMKQRLGIAQALLNEPKLLICDEPTSALDPVGRKEILDILAVVKDRTTVVFSTHILSDVERICDRIGILHEGTLVMNGKLSDVKSSYRHDMAIIECTNLNETNKLKAGLLNDNLVSKIYEEGNKLQIDINDKNAYGKEILKWIALNDITIIRYERMEPTLENVFMEVIE